MGYVINTNNHGVVPSGGSRVPAGRVVEVSGDEEKALLKLNGVEKSSKDDFEAQQGVGHSDEKSGDAIVLEGLNEVASTTGAILSAGGQVVIGDDEAPLGPPTGVRSTKRAEAEKDLASRLAFADHEALSKVPEDDAPAVTPHSAPNSQAIHNAQHDAGAAADEIAKEINSEYAQREQADGDDSEAEGEPQGDPAVTE